MTTDDPDRRPTAQDEAREGAQDDAETPQGQGARGAQGDETDHAGHAAEGAQGARDEAAADAKDHADEGGHGARGKAAGAKGERAAGAKGEDAPAAADAPAAPAPTAPAPTTSAPAASAAPDRVYRSGAGIAGGVMVLALVAWLGIDALVRGHGRTPWLALATLLLLVPLVSTFTVRPAVFANDDRLRVRNPFRTITLPWAAVAELRSGYSNEVVDRSGTKYQLWAIPVSLRARKRAGRAELRATEGGPRRGGSPFGASRSRPAPGGFGGSPSQGGGHRPTDSGATHAPADRAMNDLRELVETRADLSTSQGDPEVRWCYEIIAPALAGAVLLAVLLGVG